MNEDELVLEPQVETEAETGNTEAEVDVLALTEELEKEKRARQQLTARSKDAEAKAKALEARLSTQGSAPLAVEDYIDISNALAGLDPVEQAFVSEQHKLSGKSLREIRESSNFQNWQVGHNVTKEKENALKPSATQQFEDVPKSLADRLRNANLTEKEEILREQGMYKEFRPRADKAYIGVNRR